VPGKAGPPAESTTGREERETSAGATCRAPATMYMPPLDYKREGIRNVEHNIFSTSSSLQLLLASPSSSSNPRTHIVDVGCYAPAARTTLNPCATILPR
jgi:hypothetical protein